MLAVGVLAMEHPSVPFPFRPVSLVAALVWAKPYKHRSLWSVLPGD
ncbi:hypothetical protein DUNSADRAFT_14396 [Dunaliella salina]|uniref:Uncharacterized protein n=1 Tax=Dunaliella salina TaxID=3046 RepID=A0ABQ7G7F5_DUNSA|nr:hypothetical protein DUNSADRAFT_14396 [Dunaliella salina]|eukprot:KAF5830511.1 hypothetical protein DUNSADRAFT_14396 [Dunaliella salina]